MKDQARAVSSKTNLIQLNKSEEKPLKFKSKLSSKSPSPKEFSLSNFKSVDNLLTVKQCQTNRKLNEYKPKNGTEAKHHPFSLKWFQRKTKENQRDISKQKEEYFKNIEKQNEYLPKKYLESVKNEKSNHKCLSHSKESREIKSTQANKMNSITPCNFSPVKINSNLQSITKQKQSQGPKRKYLSNKIESKGDYDSQEEVNENNIKNSNQASPSKSNENAFSAKQSRVFNRLYNGFELSKNKRDLSLK